MNFFLPKLTFHYHLQKVYMAFYLLTWTYFNDVSVGRNILINSQLIRILFMSIDMKKWKKTEKGRKNMEKEIKPMKVISVKMRYQIWILLKPFEYDPKTNIGDINSSASDDEEEGAEYKVKRISNSKELTVKGASVVEKRSLADVLQYRCQTWNCI